MSRDILSTDFASHTNLTPLEREVLTQYQTLASKLRTLAEEIRKIHQSSDRHSASVFQGQAYSLLQNMRGLERKMGLVYTQFRTAVYALQIQNEETRLQTEGGRKKSNVAEQFPDTDEDVGNHVRQLVSEDEGTTVVFDER